MLTKHLSVTDKVPDGILSALERRDVALWIRDLPTDLSIQDVLEKFIGLPWRLVISEAYESKVFNGLEAEASFKDPMTRKRGFVQVIDSDPTKTELPQRCLPIYLLNARTGRVGATDFASRLRRMTMLEELRRSGTRDLLVISALGVVPPELTDLWDSGFRTHVTFVSDTPNAEEEVAAWLDVVNSNATLLLDRPTRAIESIFARYTETYPEERHLIRVRDVHGAIHRIDVSEADEPERPLTDFYSLIEERDLAPLMPEDLSEEEFVGFFRDSTSSWRPYAAGVSWFRDQRCRNTLSSLLAKIDDVGPDENCIAYISSESGAGGTTLARALGWEFAREGYPVLLAKQLPFAPDALPVANFLNRVRGIASARIDHTRGLAIQGEADESGDRRYEAPWVIIFDTVHWQNRDSELVQFRNEMEKAGRPVCLLVVAGSILGPSFRNSSIFKKLIDLNHIIDLEESTQLGNHLNKFLRIYGKQREKWQWERFYEDHTLKDLAGTAAFWVALSFWIQGQYDLSESIQEWMYRCFKQNAADVALRLGLLRIAAMSTERFPLPEPLLPRSTGQWPVSYALEEARALLAALGLTRISSAGQEYWALIHDIQGRFLINALFYDKPTREELGLGSARDPEELRFILLRQISIEPAIGERNYRSLGEDFATAIFKIDQDHGRSSFAPFWRDLLAALAQMPKALRDTSRLFRHHVAISRRRIAKLDERLYNISPDEKLALINEAIEDLNYALLHIAFTPGTETDLNLLNSLANAYFDLANAEEKRGTSREKISEILRLANDATRRAYDESPTNSFVIETYVKNLLHTARELPERAVETCIEILTVVSSALTSNESAYRTSQLSNLADQALNILLLQTATGSVTSQPRTPTDVLVLAWQALAEDGGSPGMSLAEVPESNRAKALEVLASDAGRGNTQVIALRYSLLCVGQPFAFKQQLELVEQLQATNRRLTPQLRLEYAILLFQDGRASEGDKAFRVLRHLWRESEHFVEVPERLRWLRGPDGKTLKTVKAAVSSDYGTRFMARVRDFGSALVPFRPEEHALRNPRVGIGFTCHVSFGHNGPFLRPVTAGTHA